MSSTVFGLSYDARAVAAFRAASLGRTITEGAASDHAVVAAGDVASSGHNVAFHQVSEGKTVKNRLHLDLTTTDFNAELARLKGIGAEQLHEVQPVGTGSPRPTQTTTNSTSSRADTTAAVQPAPAAARPPS
jgi:hypothetical protein